MKDFKRLFIILIAVYILIIAGCKKDDLEDLDLLRELYETYTNGEISECYYNGEFVFSAGHNSYDAGGAIYDQDGEQIGTCNYAWGQPDEICGELENCEVIYRVSENIWGQPAVDKYGLGE